MNLFLHSIMTFFRANPSLYIELKQIDFPGAASGGRRELCSAESLFYYWMPKCARDMVSSLRRRRPQNEGGTYDDSTGNCTQVRGLSELYVSGHEVFWLEVDGQVLD